MSRDSPQHLPLHRTEFSSVLHPMGEPGTRKSLALGSWTLGRNLLEAMQGNEPARLGGSWLGRA